MQLRILPSAFGDLDRGRAFYAQHGEELGDYFLDSLFADIDSLALYAGIHTVVWGFHRMLAQTLPICHLLQGRRRRVYRVAHLGLQTPSQPCEMGFDAGRYLGLESNVATSPAHPWSPTRLLTSRRRPAALWRPRLLIRLRDGAGD